jgi:hypothetical protein
MEVLERAKNKKIISDELIYNNKENGLFDKIIDLFYPFICGKKN